MPHTIEAAFAVAGIVLSVANLTGEIMQAEAYKINTTLIDRVQRLERGADWFPFNHSARRRPALVVINFMGIIDPQDAVNSLDKVLKDDPHSPDLLFSRFIFQGMQDGSLTLYLEPPKEMKDAPPQ